MRGADIVKVGIDWISMYHSKIDGRWYPQLSDDGVWISPTPGGHIITDEDRSGGGYEKG